MSCSVPVFARIQDVNRVVSILNDAPISGEQDVKENIGKWADFIAIFNLLGPLFFNRPFSFISSSKLISSICSHCAHFNQLSFW